MSEHDVFLSFGGHDRAIAERIAQELRNRGLSVFVDEDIQVGHGVSVALQRALAASRLLLLYYSAGYPSRYACQFELTAALLAGQREGDPVGRIVVINPEPGEDHLFPVELADATFSRAPRYGDKAAFEELAAVLRERVRSMRGTIGDPRTGRPRWITDRVAGAYSFVGRYREQWRLHSELRQGDYPLVRQVMAGPVVALLGVAGVGKSALAAAYAWQFGAAYPGGVHLLDLKDASAADMMVRYNEELRRVARDLRLDPGLQRVGAAELAAAVSDRLCTAGQPALWVVDDLPPDLDPAEIEQFLLPAGPLLHTVLTSRRGPYAELMPVVELGPMFPEDAQLLLRRHRPVDTEEDVAALDVLADRLGGHALSLQLAGLRLRDRQGLRPLIDDVDRLTADPTTLDAATDLVRDSLGSLDSQQRLVLQLATVCAGASLPARFIADVETVLHPDAGDPGDALAGLRDLTLATRIEDNWEVHAIVREAARRHLPLEVPEAELVRVAADLVLARSSEPGAVADRLMPHAAVLAAHPALAPGTARALHRMLTDFHQTRGEPLTAARHWDLALTSGSPTTSELLRAAHAHLDAGSYEQAAEYASRARGSVPSGGQKEIVAIGVLAQALDALGRLDEADPHWEVVRAALPPTPANSWNDTGDAIELQLGYLKGRRLRGDLRVALRHADQLVDVLSQLPSERAGNQLQAARIELATIQLSTNAQREARLTARSVQSWYEDQGLADHMNAVSAQSVLAQAWLTLYLLELDPNPADWREAAERLGQLRERLRGSHGPMNARTLSIDVEYGYALLCLGRPKKARKHLEETISRLGRRFGPRHPMILRAQLLLGRSHAQLREHEKAREHHELAFEGLLATLGPRHPDTLQAQYGLGVALVLLGSRSKGRRMLSAVRTMAPSSVGRNNDLYAQSVVATALGPLPSSIWRYVDKKTNDRPRPQDDP
ncbi:tetratricopeptide repeat protein [Streptomyces sp. NPDC057253]|uniref:tetratricopeptide repeat protein n=1 Tax=Streptomyces sp. NPDC057253 TaxID=3346069 RepID=UPI00362B8C73